ncbi:unnamed protein product [Urochloa humidicola]
MEQPVGKDGNFDPESAYSSLKILEMNPEDEAEEDGANIDLDSQRKGKCVVLKTSTRQTIFLPVVGLVDPDKLKPGDLVGVNKDSYLILDTLPSEYDSRVKAMEVDEKPTEDYNEKEFFCMDHQEQGRRSWFVHVLHRLMQLS